MYSFSLSFCKQILTKKKPQLFREMLNNSSPTVNPALIYYAFMLSEYIQHPSGPHFAFLCHRHKNVDQLYVCVSIYSSLSSANYTNPACSSSYHRLTYSSYAWVFQLNSQRSDQSHPLSLQVRLDSDVCSRELAHEWDYPKGTCNSVVKHS